MRKLFILLSSVVISWQPAVSQDYSLVEKTGIVTYISSQNVYVRFQNTSGIEQGDTLFIKKNEKYNPVVVVKFISSTSCAGELIEGKKIILNDQLLAKAKIINSIEEIKSEIPKSRYNSADTVLTYTNTSTSITKKSKPPLSGRISVQSFSNLTNFDRRGDYQRWRYSLSLKANQIGESRFSLSTYTNFSYRSDQWKTVGSNLGRSLRVYDLSLQYRFDETMNLWAGRHLNRKMSNISSVDGIQIEKYFGENYAGIIAGSRPNFSDMGWNSKLFQFGGYFGRTDTVNNRLVENTVGVIQQTNDFKTDRRFIYFQHNNSLFYKVNLFLSSEIDLYKKLLEKESNEFILTSLYSMIRYSPSRIFSIAGSYDARKNVIYYETFKNFIDSVFENETRKGATLRITVSPVENLFLGLSGGYRDSKNDLRPSKNSAGYITYSRIPFIEASSTLSYNYITSSYVDGSVYGIRISKSLIYYDADISVGYRKTQYSYIINSSKTEQDNINIDLSVRLFNKTYLNCGYEGYFEAKQSQTRVLIDITTRF